MDELLEIDFTLAPTQLFYDYLRDMMARRELKSHVEYASADLLKLWELQVGNHPGILDWKTED